MPSLIDALYGGLALAVFVVSAVLIRAVCRRGPVRRLGLALTLDALAGCVALFRSLVPAAGAWVTPYLAVLFLFAIAYTAFKVAEVLVLDVTAGRRGWALPPAILRDIVSAVFAAILLVVLLRAVLGVDVTALVATSAALSIVLGLALQETLANLFAGLALTIERPFRAGDWVQFDGRIGQVKEVNWRAVKLQILKQDDTLVIPNSVIAKTQFVNLSQPPRHGHAVEVGVAYDEPPNRVRHVLIQAAGEVAEVLRDPPPGASVVRFDTYAIVYRLRYWIDDCARLPDIESEVLAHVWYAFRRHGIQIPFPRSTVYTRPVDEADHAAREERLQQMAGLLSGVDFLAALGTEDIETLAREVRPAPYPPGLVVVRQGEPGDSLFVIVSGKVEVLMRPAGGGPERAIATIERGDYFGEMSLLTGEPRAATVRTLDDTELLVLTRDTLRPVLLGDPTAAERLSLTLARRKGEHEDTLRRVMEVAHGAEADLPHLLLGRIRRFFGLREV